MTRSRNNYSLLYLAKQSRSAKHTARPCCINEHSNRLNYLYKHINCRISCKYP